MTLAPTVRASHRKIASSVKAKDASKSKANKSAARKKPNGAPIKQERNSIKSKNARLVAMLRKLAGCYRVRRSIIERDINEADRAARLKLDADRLDAKAADWERNPPH